MESNTLCFIDELKLYLLKESKRGKRNKSNINLDGFNRFLLNNNYDTDSIIEDIDNTKGNNNNRESNIYTYFNDDKFWDLIVQFTTQQV